MNEFLCYSVEDTLYLGKKIGSFLRGGEIFGLCGELGSGKTMFVKGVAIGLGYDGYVKSPTFTIINQYQTQHVSLIHIDIYRLTTFEELMLIGYESYLSEDYVVVIEWFDKFPELSKYPHMKIDFEYVDTSVRRLKFYSNFARYNELLKQL
ncbi:MAG: tRNA (adenosine(37)-N6)-threonylcarbamoyltransferase complex ATPase subunit type 1 TsaE [Deltaproteobacteria bacterium]|nr:tRNA (adenosine(37)-N6)-threonylcarbamoyltransferase complex ATPase subunit type 1 TsaE [Deltaproteobacteria bacterium]